ncbi:MAG TPA: hypothetical protein VHH12_14425, partial [Mycobacterium sp.]|nr:hypothetical protein [Mycobacterium sp.]
DQGGLDAAVGEEDGVPELGEAVLVGHGVLALSRSLVGAFTEGGVTVSLFQFDQLARIRV